MKELMQKYQSRQSEFSEKATTLKAKYDRFSIIRLVSFVVAIGIVIFLWAEIAVWAGVVAMLVAIVAFGKFMSWHQAIQKEQKHYQHLAQINADEQTYMQHDFSPFGDGEHYQDPNHSYTYDLDVFGPYSFFQSINRTSSIIGSNALADYLKDYVGQAEIGQRQEAIQELADKLDFRQNFQAIGKETVDSIQHIDELKIWLNEPPFIKDNKVYQIMRWLAPVFAIVGGWLYANGTPGILAALSLIPAAWVLKKTLDQVNIAHNQTGKAAEILAQYGKLMAHLEKADFNAPKLQALQSRFQSSDKLASQAIKRLSYLIEQLNLRYNGFTILINITCLWDIHWMTKLEIWKEGYKGDLLTWFDALAEIEALQSFGNLYHNNPEWIFPTVSDEPIFKGTDLGHPLIERTKRITNDVTIPTQGHIKLVTGSNMAGKSTFLRTVGLNIVLANIGSPVCAQAMQLPTLKVYTSMRTTDALHESTSSFYAELKRLKFIIDAVESGENIFFLLDEILKGTNSRDRHTGSRALINQLIEDKGSGIIATHDLELGDLEANAAGAIENLRIEVEIKDGKLHFDYKLKKGVSVSFNATYLMKDMGIKIR